MGPRTLADGNTRTSPTEPPGGSLGSRPLHPFRAPAAWRVAGRLDAPLVLCVLSLTLLIRWLPVFASVEEAAKAKGKALETAWLALS